jgi:uncharacterized repeat protein (TIGR01451 family)
MLLLLACAALSGLLGVPPAAAFVPPGHAPELPDIDKRREAPSNPLPPAKAAAAGKLRSQVRGLRLEHDALRHSPKHIASTAGLLSGPGGEGLAIAAAAARGLPADDPYRPIKAFLSQHQTLFGHGAEALDQARLHREFLTRHNGLRTVVWEQRVDDVAVYEGVLIGHITRQGELAGLSSQFIAEPERAADAGTPDRAALLDAPGISAAQAVLLAAEAIEEPLEPADIIPLPAAGQQAGRPESQQVPNAERSTLNVQHSARPATFKAGPLPGDARVRLVWLPMNESSLLLCWEVELTRRAGGERYRILLDARTGDLQLRRRLTLYLTDTTYRVFTSDSPKPFSPGWPAPDTNQPPTVARSLVTLSALNTNASPIGWISDGENETRGNNVDAHADRNADDIADLPRPQGSPFRVFDLPLDLTQPPTSYTDAAVVQLFYWCNWIHDRLYELGFDEPSGNFQKDNFGRGGLGGDAIQADAQDGSGFNNANFTPTFDGESGRIQMFLFDGPEPDLDGDLDAEVILHEYVHGLSTRLVGGGDGLGAAQSAGLGEGWSDFYAMAFLSQPGDDLDAPYPYGAYASTLLGGLKENYYFGIRRYPYSTDLTRNPLTFKDIDPTQISPHSSVPMNPIFGGFSPLQAAEVHSQGEVWCQMLLEARANLIRRHGYATGNQLILQLVTDGLKLSPPNPSFTQARDAILLADQVNNQGANHGELWRAFAKRGLGFSAVAPDSNRTVGVVEAFDLPDALFVVNTAAFVAGGPISGPLTPTCQNYPLTNLSEQTITWTVRVTQPWLAVSPSGGTLAPGAATNVTVCLTSNALGLPLGRFTDTITFSNLISGVAQERDAEVRVAAFTLMPFAEDFESGSIAPYWFVSGSPGQATQISPLNGPRGSNHLTLDSVGNFKARNEFTLGLDLAGYTNVVLSFWARSFGDEPDGPPPSPFLAGADFDGVAISEDGVAWYEVQSLRRVPSNYTNYIVDLDAAIAAHGLRYNATFRIRFNHVDDFQIPFDGLALDDIAITGTAARRLSVVVPGSAVEGAGVLRGQGTVTLGVPAPEPIVVSLSSSEPGRIAVPPSVLLPAGSDRVLFDLTVLENATLDGTVSVALRAEAAGYSGGHQAMAVFDNETATLTVRLPARVSEGRGARREARGVVRSSARPQRDVLVQLSSSDPEELHVPASVLLPAGQARVEFDLMPVDDRRIDGPRSVTVTAHVENWIDGHDSTLVLDNDEPALFVTLPASAGEGNGLLTNAGVIRLSGTLPTNLVVALASSDRTELLVPPFVEIQAGEFAAGFDLTTVDDRVIDGQQTVTVSAWAPGFGSGSGRKAGRVRLPPHPDPSAAKVGSAGASPSRASSAMLILDDETPPVPFRPNPPDGATNVAVSLAVSWNPGVGELLINGGFETGDFTGWNMVSGGYGAWVINDGTLDPDGPEGTNTPLAGRFNAMVMQSGGGHHVLYQDVFIPPDALSAEWSWWDKIRNHTAYFAPNQVFRAEVRDTNHAVLATAFTTQPGDPLLAEWQPRRFDLAPFRGRLVRLAFYEEDSTGYFNVLLDDVSVRLGEAETPTTHDVYFGTTPTPGAAEFRGNTTNAFWPLPSLALDTTYYWRVVARRGAATTPGPVWRFTTRGAGGLHHFEWGPIASPQVVGQRFAVTLTARDDINNPVRDFDAPVNLLALTDGGNLSTVVISEVDVGANDRVEFANVSEGVVDVGGWKITVFDSASWPAPLTTVTVPNGSRLAPGGVFVLNDSGVAPGQFPLLNAGTNVNWNMSGVGNPIAVLLRDASGNVVDFFCGGTAAPTLITTPVRIPPEEWSGLPVSAALPLITLTLQRIGHRDQNDATDWTGAPGTFGTLNPGLVLPFERRGGIEIEPSVLTNFTTGVWSGFLTVREPAARLTLRADDGHGRIGLANEFAVGARNDLAVSVADSPDVVILGNELTYRVTVTNSGPDKATGVILTNQLPPEVSFLSYATFNGACWLCAGQGGEQAGKPESQQAGRGEEEQRGFSPFPLFPSAPLLVCALDNLSAGDSARITITTRAASPGVFTNVASVVRAEPDGYTLNNTALAVTTVTGPFIALTNQNLTEGSNVTNVVRLPVRLSAPCPLPVSVGFATSNDTAVAGQDFLGTNGVLVFEPGVTSLVINVPIFGDLLDENLETALVSLFSPTNGVIRGDLARIRILDDDPPPLVSIDDASVTEGPPGSTNDAAFTVRLGAPSAVSVSVRFSTANRTATAPGDYLTTFGQLTFPPGTTQQMVRVPVLGDHRFEAAEVFAVVLTNAIAASLGREVGLGTILDDDDTELDHFVWSAVASPQFVDLPFIATLSARDGLDRPATGFHGSVTVRGVADSREVTAGTGTNEWEFPLGTLYHDARTQVIYLPQEVLGARPEARGDGSDLAPRINALALEVASLPGQVLSNWTIRLKHSSATNYVRAAWESDGWTTVHRNDETLQAAGWVTFLFAEPFDYNGTNSLMVDLSFNNATYSVNGLCRSTVMAQPRSVYFQTDSAFGDPLDWSKATAPPPLLAERVPNARFLIESPVAIVPSGVVQLNGGVWSAPMTVREPGTSIFLRASDAAGHIANGNLFAVEPSDDADGDGLPDAWEVRYFGSTATQPHADADADGLDNREEFRAGTDPAVAASVLKIQNVQVRGADVVIQFASVSGKAYRLERTQDLTGAGWATVNEFIPGNGEVMEITVQGAAGGASAFFQLKIVP